MDLKEFTKQTLVQIVEGVKEANNIIANNNAHIHVSNNRCDYGKQYPITNVDFDVAITATETEGANGGGGLKVASLLSIGGGVESKSENQTVSRIKYTIPLVLGTKNN